MCNMQSEASTHLSALEIHLPPFSVTKATRPRLQGQFQHYIGALCILFHLHGLSS